MKTSSRSAATTSSSTTQTSRNLNIEGTEGITVGEAGGNVQIMTTDFNAIGDASEIARRSVDVAGNVANDAQRLALETNLTVTDFATKALEGQGDVASSAFSTVDKALGQVQDLARDAVAYIGEFVRDLQGTAQTQLGDTVKSLNAISVEQNKSSDQRIAELSGNTIRYMVIGIGVVAGALTLYAIFKRGN